MSESPLFKEPSRLDESYTPALLTEREPLVADVVAHLRTFLSGGPSLHILMHGRPGTGKTAVARRVLQEVTEQTQARTAFVNCWETPTLFGIAESLRLQLRVMFAERGETSYKIARIRKVLGDHRLVLVLDELDRVPPSQRDDILYTFTQWPNAALVCLANSREFLMDLERRVLSRFNPLHIECPEYVPDEIFRLLVDRAAESLSEGTYDHALLRVISVECGGDARLAIGALRRAAQLAEVRRRPTINSAEITRAFDEMRLVHRKHNLDRLGPHHRIIFELVEREPGISSRALWESYQVECQRTDRTPVALRTFTSYVDRLIQLKLIRAEPKPGDGTARVFFVT